jgi:PAS domain S-box-containing protein
MFASVIILFMYLFEPGIKYFLMHPPLIVLPIILGFIGIAGILSAWTAAAIAEPLEYIEESLTSGDPALDMHLFDSNSGTEEATKVVNSIRNYQDKVLSKESKQAVAMSRSQLASTLVMTVSLRGIILSSNLAVEIFTGIARKDMRYRELGSLIAPETDENDKTNFLDAIHSGSPFTDLDIPFIDMDGTTRTMTWASTPVFDTAGRKTGLLLFGKDIS